MAISHAALAIATCLQRDFMNPQVVVVHVGGVGPLAAHDFGQFAKLVHVAVGLHSEIDGVPSGRKAARRR